MSEYYIGVISGTSCDAIDIAIVDFSTPPFKLVHTYAHAIPEAYKTQLQLICEQGRGSVQQLGTLDNQYGQLIAEGILAALTEINLPREDILAIGSHGQTAYHQPQGPCPFTLQIGDANVIAKQTGILTIADFRRADMALGGQGAPLVPRFHQWCFQQEDTPRMILNIGGIANITYLPPKSSGHPILGFDTGPGNGLMDAWTQIHQQQPYDKAGQWAATGSVIATLLNTLRQDSYFKKKPPKSTGKEYFNLDWLQTHAIEGYSPADVQATLLAFTAQSIANDIQPLMSGGEILACGGGAYNTVLMDTLANTLGSAYRLETTTTHGVHANWVEAICFAWLAKARLSHMPGNVPEVTGAREATLLGAVYCP